METEFKVQLIIYRLKSSLSMMVCPRVTEVTQASPIRGKCRGLFQGRAETVRGGGNGLAVAAKEAGFEHQ